jgi:hypothetical protein
MKHQALVTPGAPDARLLAADAGASAVATLVMAPGGACRADRYGWLAPLTERGIHVLILDGVLSQSVGVPVPGPSPAILQLASACARALALGVPVHAAGHSAGAAAFLDALDPAANAAASLPANFQLPSPLASMTSLGCSLQPLTLNFVLPHRSEDRPLFRPSATRLTFVAGKQDAMAPPELVRRTASRYTPAADFVLLDRATHYGWAGPREPGDNPLSDVDVTFDTAGQRAHTRALLARIILA